MTARTLTSLILSTCILCMCSWPAFPCGAGYLAVLGPTPMRLLQEKSRTDSTVLAAILFEEPAPDEPVPAVEPAMPAPMPELPVAFSFPSTPLWSSLVEPVESVEELPFSAPTVSTSESYPPAANELLVVTPQMLVDYFRPIRNGRNGATNHLGVTVLLPVTFTPPAAQTPPSSQAIYRTP